MIDCEFCHTYGKKACVLHNDNRHLPPYTPDTPVAPRIQGRPPLALRDDDIALLQIALINLEVLPIQEIQKRDIIQTLKEHLAWQWK